MEKKEPKATRDGKLEYIDLKSIHITPGHNPRQIDLKTRTFQDLVESVKAQGVIVPVHVRITGGMAGPFELLAGERRYRAAQAAGLTTIPAINHGAIGDERAFEITFAENFAREDLTTLEQGRAVGFLLERYKGDYAAVASKLGKPESWVRMRHAIETNLDQEWKALVSPGARLERWTAAHLELIARFPAGVQLNILKDVGYRSDLSVKELAQKVADQLRLIRKASFDSTRCIKCAKRSDAQPELWSDPASQKVGAGDRCLDAQCWARKDLAARKQKLAEFRKKYPGLVSICTKDYLWGDEERKARSNYGNYLTAGDYETCKKSEPKAVPAVIVNGKGAGKIQYVTIKHPDSPQAPKARPKPFKDRRKEWAEALWLETIRRMGEQISKLPIDAVMGKNGMRAIVWMAALYGTGDGTFGEERASLLKEFEKGASESAAVPLQVIWQEISGSMDYITDGVGDARCEGRVLAQLFGLDLEAEYCKVCEDPEFAEPAEWASLNADGTPKNVKTKKAKSTLEVMKEIEELDRKISTAHRNKAKDKKAPASQGRPPGKAWQKLLAGDKKRVCRVCGCTDAKACMVDGEPCHWIEPDLCSKCETMGGKKQPAPNQPCGIGKRKGTKVSADRSGPTDAGEYQAAAGNQAG